MRKNSIFDFWSKVDIGPATQCWNWKSCLDSDGYGVFRLWGRRKAHQVAFLATTKIPLKHNVLHTCDNRACCNPNHLYDGTTQQNTKDRDERNRNIESFH